MLPICLELRNFLAYHEPPPLSFEGIKLACLSGPNGAGKSSLLDAMTWALWGRARGQSDDDLIRMGFEEMSVKFTFRQEQQLFRVTRKRSKKGRGQSALELVTWDEDVNDWRVISESSIRETQNRITAMLRLDYETFVHSAFLQQGRADSFTIETPAKRKKILAEILGLSRWEEYEAQAKEQLRDIDEQHRLIRYEIDKIEREQQQEPALRAELSRVSQNHEQARQAREEAEQRLAEVSGAQTHLQAAEGGLDKLAQQNHAWTRDIADLETKLTQQCDSLAQIEQTLAGEQAIEAGYRQLEEARQLVEAFNDKLGQIDGLKDHLNVLTRELDAERAALDAQTKAHRKSIREAEKAAAELGDIEAGLEAVASSLDHLSVRKAEREVIQAAREELVKEEADRRSQNKALKAEMDELRKRLDMIEAVEGAVCPVCGQPLDDAHRAEMTEQYQVEGTQRGDVHRENQARLAEIKQAVVERDALLREIDADLRDLDGLAAQQGSLRERRQAAQLAIERLEMERAALAEIQVALDEDTFGLELREQIAEVQGEIDSLGYDSDAHAEVRKRIRELKSIDAQMQKLQVAREIKPTLETTIKDLEKRRVDLNSQLDQHRQEISDQEQEVELWRERVKEEKRRQTEVNQQRKTERDAYENQVRVEQQLRAIEDERKRMVGLLDQRAALEQDQAVYEQLREAFGKNGIPAMIIETAIPELEEATNKLLMRMTDGRMSVRFDTQRANKTGDGVRETLDIVIGDELGTRDYSLFSGGEGFRVNFALRIALSQFLARRAGARLQTLVIDEGFGSQDDAGRERLIEAINAIRSDFDLILIVTHLDDLRDAFPVHLEVRKLRDGSTITIT